MNYYRHRIFHLLLLTIHLSFASQHRGHLEPFGSSGPFEQIDELINNFPSPTTFFNDYVTKSRAVLFRQGLINDPHLSMWQTDDRLNELFAFDKSIVHVETRKKEDRKQDILTMTMSDFLKRYQTEELYLVEEVPQLLRPYLILPKCLQCPPAIETFQVAMMWYSSGNTSSVVHTDDYDNINCVLEGEKQFILIDSIKHEDVAMEIIDNFSGSYSSLDVDRVDYEKYPSLDSDNVHYYRVIVNKGDCLFIPALWIHQVRSTSRNIAVNYWLNHQRAISALVDKTNCPISMDAKNGNHSMITLDTIDWPKEEKSFEQLKQLMFDLIDADSTSFKEWTSEFSKELDFDLQSNIQTITLFAEFFAAIDINDNGFVTIAEVESIFNSNNVTMVYDILQDIMDVIDAKSGNDTWSNDMLNSIVDDSIEDLSYDTYRTNDTFSGDEEDSHEHEEL